MFFLRRSSKNQSFVKRIKRADEASQENDVKSLSGRNNRFLSDKIRLQKLAKYRKVCESQRLKMYNLCKTIARLRSSRKTLLDRIGENANRGDVSAIINQKYCNSSAILLKIFKESHHVTTASLNNL